MNATERQAPRLLPLSHTFRLIPNANERAAAGTAKIGAFAGLVFDVEAFVHLKVTTVAFRAGMTGTAPYQVLYKRGSYENVGRDGPVSGWKRVADSMCRVEEGSEVRF